jgi:hypothetical protein
MIRAALSDSADAEGDLTGTTGDGVFFLGVGLVQDALPSGLQLPSIVGQ